MLKWMIESRTMLHFTSVYDYFKGLDVRGEQQTILNAIPYLSDLCADQGKLDEAEQMYERIDIETIYRRKVTHVSQPFRVEVKYLC